MESAGGVGDRRWRSTVRGHPEQTLADDAEQDRAVSVPGGAGRRPRRAGASQMAMAGPPAGSILFNFPSAKKPTNRLSADQKGIVAPSVPSSDRADGASSGRTQSRCVLSVLATNARRRPSGERASRFGGVPAAPTPPMTQPSGGRIVELKAGALSEAAATALGVPAPLRRAPGAPPGPTQSARATAAPSDRRRRSP